ncbi:hypothetical protein EVAR_26538_1 [Eumeta japonica]|uniref:Uncharacterized protein n=1 Tax=Eumeta variegata TaxID=151549 RepID=A0A4C1YP44_EUMVA|nr:hypothetical protein EVAR_26538_1 [Eumeta japonica]
MVREGEGRQSEKRLARHCHANSRSFVFNIISVHLEQILQNYRWLTISVGLSSDFRVIEIVSMNPITIEEGLRQTRLDVTFVASHFKEGHPSGFLNFVDLVAQVHRFYNLDGESRFAQSSIHCCSEFQPSSLNIIVDPCTRKRPRTGSSPHTYGKRDCVMNGATCSHIYHALEETVPPIHLKRRHIALVLDVQPLRNEEIAKIYIMCITAFAIPPDASRVVNTTKNYFVRAEFEAGISRAIDVQADGHISFKIHRHNASPAVSGLCDTLSSAALHSCRTGRTEPYF